MKKKTTYFGYGSNLWRDQMKRRCPKSTFIGIGILHNWRWIINERGYANVVPSQGDYVYGFLYTLTANDEHDLDIYEGAAYQKHNLAVEPLRDGKDRTDTILNALVYVDVDRRTESQPKTEYTFRMNKGIKDALDAGVPSEYIDTYLRPYIPDTLSST
ncbi:hypothetical protein CVT24_006800 [Panaeolus cyanescens]|uniref:gamma-glutamylcyclotransferase n=1 Tax=Panaeolus cyanescens TaxID=181874 RepID=A0A409VD04_9AGAR|nr:hypothetical protein CVT24_006800 [Panaeolus cyanescens]